MAIKNISSLINDEQTVQDILNDLDDVAVVSINDRGVGHSYIGEYDIAAIDEDILDSKAMSFFIVKKSFGYEVYIEI